MISSIRRLLGGGPLLLLWIFILSSWIWSVGAIWFDFPSLGFRHLTAIVYALASLGLLIFFNGSRIAKICTLTMTVSVACWWLTLRPHSDRDWEADVSRQPWAETTGDLITLHNVRNCNYRMKGGEVIAEPRWETRAFNLSELTGVDVALNYWGSSWMAHPIISFQFRNSTPIAFSIEIRREKGESYSALGGLYRQYELTYIVGDERDLIRVRTNYRKGELVYLYRTTIPPPEARERFQEYISAMNDLVIHPRWYNAITANCTTSIRSQRTLAGRQPWDWRMLLNGKIDELFFQRGLLFTDGLPFTELKERAIINKDALAADQSPDFSLRIRRNKPGFCTKDSHR